MMKLMDFFRLIRYKNLLIIILTMYAIRYGIIYPFLQRASISMQFDELHFLLLVIATVCIAAAGYAINDYFDIRSDIANHPESVLVGTKISRRSALTINNVLNLIGVVLGFYVSAYIHLTKFGLLFILVSATLWFYSSYFKKLLLWGNIVVAAFSALIPLIPVLFEIPLLNKIIILQHIPVQSKIVSVIFFFALGYSYFAFLLTLIREIIKDMEDMQGDSELGRRTLPLVIGIQKSKYVIYAITLIVILSIAFIYIIFFQDLVSLIYLALLVVAPLVFIIYRLYKASGQKEFFAISKQLKIVMFFGLAFVVVLCFILLG